MEEKTIQQIAIDEDVAPTRISDWKKELQERMGELFERKKAAGGSIKCAKRRPPAWSARSANSSLKRNSSKKVGAAGDRSERKAMIETHHPKLSVRSNASSSESTATASPRAKSKPPAKTMRS